MFFDENVLKLKGIFVSTFNYVFLILILPGATLLTSKRVSDHFKVCIFFNIYIVF